MKYSLCLTALAATTVLSFPSRMFDASAFTDEEKRNVADIKAAIEADAEKRAVETRAQYTTAFNAAQQYVSNQGQHAFVAPGPNDLRGPCPGLNAMANHGYIPHNGVATIQQFITGTYDGKVYSYCSVSALLTEPIVFGMGLDLAAFLAVYGAVFDGDLTSWSIGGPPSASLLSITAGLLGTPQGISGSHNKYESDASPTRPDLYE